MVSEQHLPEYLTKKIQILRKILQRYSNVAVAFSGGVDSTLLLHNCCRALDPERVTAFHAVSCLQANRTVHFTRQIIATHFANLCSYREVEVAPLSWPEFVENNTLRCYFCKKATYSILLENAVKAGCVVMFDGTNTDDLQEYRPGLKAVEELGIVSPLVEAGLSKQDIRQYARCTGLINHDLPSNSCLATRIRQNKQITSEKLKSIETAETFLYDLGFEGCRVRIGVESTHIELQENDLQRCVKTPIRLAIIQYFQQNGLGPVLLDLVGR